MVSLKANHLHILCIRANILPGNVEAAKPLDEATERAEVGFALLALGVCSHHTFTTTEIHPGSGPFIGHATGET